jgi:hypothetical protein
MLAAGPRVTGRAGIADAAGGGAIEEDDAAAVGVAVLEEVGAGAEPGEREPGVPMGGRGECALWDAGAAAHPATARANGTAATRRASAHRPGRCTPTTSAAGMDAADGIAVPGITRGGTRAAGRGPWPQSDPPDMLPEG